MPHTCRCEICGNEMHWARPIDNQEKCVTCGKRLFGLSIPRLGIHEIGDFCMCVKSTLTTTSGEVNET